MKKVLLISVVISMYSCGEPEATQEEIEYQNKVDELASKTNFNLGKTKFDWFKSSEEKDSREDAKRHFELSVENNPNGDYADSSKIYLDSIEIYEKEAMDKLFEGVE